MPRSGPDGVFAAPSGLFSFPAVEGFVSAALKALEKLEFFLIAALMLCMVALYATGIAVRELAPAWSRNVAFVDEATRYMMVWMVFLGLGLALARGRHIAMSVFRDRLGDRLGQILRKLIDFVGLGFCLYITWIGLDIAQRVAVTGQKQPDARHLRRHPLWQPARRFLRCLPCAMP